LRHALISALMTRDQKDLFVKLSEGLAAWRGRRAAHSMLSNYVSVAISVAEAI
jgi:hypothetical protein